MAPKEFEHTVRVTWADCDQVRIVYTGNIPRLALDAIDAFWEHVTGGDGWYQIEADRGLGTPFVHLSMNLRKPVTPRHRLKCKVWPCGLGNTTIKFRVEGYQDNTLCFDGYFVCVFVEAKSFAKIPPPKDLAAYVAPYLRPDDERA